MNKYALEMGATKTNHQNKLIVYNEDEFRRTVLMYLSLGTLSQTHNSRTTDV